MSSFKYRILQIIFFIYISFKRSKIFLILSSYLDKIYTLWILYSLKSNNRQIEIKKFSTFRGLNYISIGENSSIQRYCYIEAIDCYGNQRFSPEIIIGKNVIIGEYNHITAIKKIVIGNGVLTGRRVTLSDNNHGNFDLKNLNIMPAMRKVVSKGEVIIEDNVWIGENVCILSGVTIGKGAIIAANAVVTKNVPCYSIAAGVPAKIIKQLNY